MNQEDKLNILKDILLTDEREYAISIEKKLKYLEDTINQQDNLSEKIDPIIKKKLDEFILEIPQSLGPTITETLKKEIQNSRDEVVEILYPIMGQMIKKYIQQEFKILSERINQSMNNTFSFKKLKRKFTSKKTGIPESDLILQEQLKPTIEQFLVIEKGSGLIISEYTKTQNIEEDMVAGMLTAIKSFAEDAFEAKNQNLQYIEYETYHIHIQNFSKYYIAVVVSGAYNIIFRDKLEDKLLDFAKNHINKKDLEDKPAFSNKLKVYFENENF